MGTSNRGKFSEKLKRILLSRKNNKPRVEEKTPVKKEEKIQLEDSKEIYNNFKKVVSVIPLIVYDSVIVNDGTKVETKQEATSIVQVDLVDQREEVLGLKQELIQGVKKDETVSQHRGIANIDSVNQNKGIPVNQKVDHKGKQVVGIANKKEKIKGIDIEEIKKQQESFDEKKGKSDDIKIKQLEKSIVNLIKKDLIKIVNQMEILQSELYILSEVNGDNKTLKECQKELDEVKSILCKIDKLKEEYNFLRDNYDFEYLLEIDNHDLVDKIIELRDSFGKNELKAVAHDYKLLDAYKFLYLKLDSLQDKTVQFEDKKKEEELKLKERDIDFDKLKREVYSVQSNNRNYEEFVSSQNRILKELSENVSKIDSYEVVDYHIKGFNSLFKNTVKYFGLLMISPLKGTIPAIAAETLITGNLIKNLYKNLQWDETKKVVYEAIDYSNLISHAINDLESTNRIVDMTLDEIVRLKMEYNDKFKIYQGDFREYRDIMHKINDMENKILGNKMKIEMMRAKALEQQRANQKKLKLVNELNNN